MASDVDMQRLIVSLEARADKFEKAMNQALGVANTRSRQIEDRFKKTNASVVSSFGGIGRAFVAAVSIQKAQQLIDASTRIENSLKVAGLAGSELTSVYERLKQSAISNAAPIESLAELYSRASLAQKELGVTSAELLGLVNNVAIALRVGGRSAQESRGALLQLSQALGAGIVRAEEFNAILEGALPIAQAAAAGLVEAGGSVAKLRTLVIDGKVSSEAFFRSIEAGAGILQDRLAGAELTVAQTTENLKTAMIDAAGKINDATGLSILLTGALNGVATSVEDVGNYFDRNKPRVKGFFGAFDDGMKVLEDWKNAFREKVGLTALDDFLEGTSVIEGRIGFQSDQINARAQELGDALGGMFKTAANVAAVDWSAATKTDLKPVSLKDFKSPAGTGSKKGPQDYENKKGPQDYENERERLLERTELIKAETTARAALNPLAKNYNEEIEKAVTKQRLLSAAQEQGLQITPQLEKTMDGLASGYARASAEAQKLEESHERMQQKAEEWRNLERDTMQGFISDLTKGTSAAESLSNALGKVADRLLDMAFNDLFSAKSGGGLLGSLLGGGATTAGWGATVTPFADGGIARNGKAVSLPRFAGGGVSNRAAIFGEAGPEAAVPLPDGRRIPVDLRMPEGPKAAPASASAPVVNFSPVFNVQAGGEQGAAALKSEVMPQLKKMVKEQIVETFNRDARFARSGI